VVRLHRLTNGPPGTSCDIERKVIGWGPEAPDRQSARERMARPSRQV